MKKTVFFKSVMLVVLLGIGLASCSNENEATDVPVMRFTTTTGEVIGDIIGGEYNLTGNDEEMVIRVLSNISWKLDVVEGREWFKCDFSEGDGMQEVNITAAVNNTLDERIAKLVLSAVDATLQDDTLTFIQPGGPRLSIGSYGIVPKEGGELAINVGSNIVWKCEIPDDVDWITLKSKTTTELVFDVDANPNAGARMADIALIGVEYTGVTGTITVRQSGAVDPAELLDVVFNADGTATDVSVRENNIYTVNMIGNEDYLGVAYNETFGFNVAQFTNPTTNVVGSSAFAMSYAGNTSFISAMDNGFSWEVLVKPHWYGEKTDNDDVLTVSNSQSGGGIAIKCSEGRGWYFEPGVGATNYIQVYEEAAMREDQWSHIVAIYGADKSISIYVNGELKNTVSNSEALRHGGAYEIVLGGRTGGSACFGGEIGIFRMYDRVLTADEVSKLYDQVDEGVVTE